MWWDREIEEEEENDHWGHGRVMFFTCMVIIRKISTN